MSNWMRLLLMPVAMGLIVGALVLGLQFHRETQTQTNVTVVVTTKDIDVGVKITPDMIVSKQMPTEFAGTNEIAPKDVIGKLAGGTMKAGEVVYPSRLIDADEAPMSYRLSEGVRAVTIKVDEITAVAFNVETGDHVDILLTMADKTGQNSATPSPAQSKVLLANVPILSKGIGRQTNGLLPAGNKDARVTSLTLGLTPDQALKLSLAEDLGKIRLVLRPANAKETSVPAPINEATIRGQ